MEINTQEEARQAIARILALLDVLSISGKRNVEIVYSCNVYLDALTKWMSKGSDI